MNGKGTPLCDIGRLDVLVMRTGGAISLPSTTFYRSLRTVIKTLKIHLTFIKVLFFQKNSEG